MAAAERPSQRISRHHPAEAELRAAPSQPVALRLPACQVVVFNASRDGREVVLVGPGRKLADVQYPGPTQHPGASVCSPFMAVSMRIRCSDVF